MGNIFDSINPTEFFTTTNGVILSLSPIITLIIGIILAFSIINIIINLFIDNNNNNNYYEKLPEYKGNYKGINPDDVKRGIPYNEYLETDNNYNYYHKEDDDFPY